MKTTENQQTTGFDAAWQLFMSSVTLGAGLSGGAVEGAFVGDRMNTVGGTAVGTELLIAGNPVFEGTSVLESGVAGGLRRDESGLALDRGKSAGGDHAPKETPRRYGALGECPRRIPA